VYLYHPKIKITSTREGVNEKYFELFHTMYQILFVIKTVKSLKWRFTLIFIIWVYISIA